MSGALRLGTEALAGRVVYTLHFGIVARVLLLIIIYCLLGKIVFWGDAPSLLLTPLETRNVSPARGDNSIEGFPPVTLKGGGSNSIGFVFSGALWVEQLCWICLPWCPK